MLFVKLMTDFFFQTKTELVKEEIETKEDSGKPVSPGINTIDNSLLDNVSIDVDDTSIDPFILIV